MPIFDTRTAHVLFTLLLFGLGLLFVYLAWETLVTFLFAILFAYLLEPAVVGLQHRLHLGRGRAVATLYLLMLIGLGIFVFFLSPRLARQLGRFSQAAPGLSASVANGRIAREVGNERGWSYDTQVRAQKFLVAHHAQIVQAQQEFLNEIGQLAGYLTWFALIPVLAAFFLLNGAAFADTLLEQLGRRRQRIFAEGLLHDIHDVLANYIRAQITLTGLAIVVLLGGFEILRVPYAMGLGVVAGGLEFIPVVGPLAAAVIVLLTAFFLNYSHILILLIFLGVWRMVQDYVNSPRIMGGQVQLHPLAVLFGILAGAEIAGVLGVYLSVPAMATLRVVWTRWRSYQNEQLLTESPAPEIRRPAA